MSLTLYPRTEPPGADASVSKAIQACLACRKQKRKCDKVLPSCALCKRMGRPCDYSDSQPPPTAEDLAALQAKLADLENRLNGGSATEPGPAVAASSFSAAVSVNDSAGQYSALREPLWQGTVGSVFPAVFFLDHDAFKWASMTIPKPPVEIPVDVLEHLGDGQIMQQVITDYFRDIHPWMPVVSKKRMSLGFPLWEAGPDLALLFLTMKLITCEPQDGILPAELSLYASAKRFLALLEARGTASLMYLQAVILVALYEYGHGIYPAAWMTVGSGVRYAEFLGLPSYKDSTTTLGTCTTWSESEERRRVWWGIVVLDRVVSLGSAKRSAAPDPSDNDVLPVDDTAWNEGNMSSTVQKLASSAMTEQLSPFARTCQASILIGHFLRHCRGLRMQRKAGSIPAFEEATRIMSDFVSLCDTSASESSATVESYSALIGARCLSCSGLIATLDIYSCPETFKEDGFTIPDAIEQESNIQMQSIEGIKNAAARVRTIAEELLAFASSPEDLCKVSPLVLDALYAGASTLHWMWKETGDNVSETGLDIIKQCLAKIGGRWRLGNEYLSIINQTELVTLR